MKSFVVFCVLVAGAFAANVSLPPKQNEKANQIATECMKESGLKPEVLAEAKKGHISDDEHLKKFTFCFFKKAGIVSEDGKLNTEVALAKLPPGVDKAEAEKLLDTCKGKTGKDVTDTVFEIFKCYHHGTKTHILLGF
ncbi:general odorant-binding protein 56d-like [Helicoverpa zea]|uniref:general odorant-binding protein 56d-like n=1 Tax=Helicoverpa zea TaxID=7113 RepID=UPI001F5A6268|nr:general odorant-binding protein 56d-like [Helicoverpa zea]